MRRSIICLAATSFLLMGPALAQEAKYTWTGYGKNVPQTNKCPTYKMQIDVTVANGRVVGLFQQEGRTQRNFNLPLLPDGSFKGEARLDANTIAVSGRISGESGEILLYGYCEFRGTLKKV